MKRYYSNGKLLLTGEYVVLDGGLSLAIPTKLGQSLTIESINEPKIVWESLDENGNSWFKDIFLVEEVSMSQAPRNDISERLIQILNIAKQLNTNFLNDKKGFEVKTKLDFPKNWGLGTSSTLINNVAQWANIDAYKLLENTFGGSGYDIACAKNNTSITYQLQESKPIVNMIDFNPNFKNHLYFVHLNKKQNSRDGIKHYRNNTISKKPAIQQINDITLKIITSDSLKDFENLISEHEKIISEITKQNTVKNLFFNDYNGAIKSLGAWGGDFILVTSNNNPKDYFNNKGYNTVIPYEKMIL